MKHPPRSPQRLSGPPVAPPFDPKGSGLRWWLFPLAGASTEDDGAGFSDPFFGDCALISHLRLSEIAALQACGHVNGLRETRCLLGLDPLGDLPLKGADNLAKSDYMTGVFRSFLAVRAGGETAQHFAQERATAIAALVSVGTCLTLDSVGGIGLWGRLTLPVLDRQIAIDIDGKTILGATIARCPHSDTPLVSAVFGLDRANLDSLFQMSPMDDLIAIVGNCGKQSHRLRMYFTAAVVAVSDALTSASLSYRLQRAINAVEAILLNAQGDWKRAEPRVRALLGDEFHALFRATECLSARHKIVHEGLIPDKELVLAAIALSVSVVFAAATLSKALLDPSIEDIRSFLDIVDAGSRVEAKLQAPQRLLINQLRSVLREPYVPLWYHNLTKKG